MLKYIPGVDGKLLDLNEPKYDKSFKKNKMVVFD